jgi:DNA-binding transcriptional LysR family regulator
MNNGWSIARLFWSLMSKSRVADSIADLHLLTVIAETRSFTQAARRLGISKSSVSERVRELERAVGMSLIRRSTRSVLLTPQALSFVEETRASFARIEHSFEQVRDLAGAPRGLVRITAPVALGRQRIAPAIPAFVRRFPEIRLELDLNDRLVNLAQENFDLAVRHARTVPETYIANVLCESRSWLLASPQYLERRGTPESPHDLAHHDCVLYLREGPVQSWSFERAKPSRQRERIQVSVQGSFKANNSEVLREAIRGGVGIGLLPDFSAEQDLRSGALVPVLAAWRPIGFFGDRIYAVRPGDTRAPRTVRHVIEFLRELFSARDDNRP